MKKYRFLSLILIVTILFGVLCPMALAEDDETVGTTSPDAQATSQATDPSETDAPEPTDTLAPGSQALPEPSEVVYASDYHPDAKAAMLIELNSNTIVYSLNPDERIYPASLTKIMTCILALEYGNLDDLLTVTDTSLLNLDMAGSTADLQVGEQMTLRNILYCMMLSSANEACNVVAEHISDDVDLFVDLMNQKAAALGCTGTHFANTHGLHDENHYTTVRDISTIARYAWQNPTFRQISSTASYTVPATNRSEPRELNSTNYLISTSYTDKYYYEKASGIKTGFTTPAGGCLVATAKDGNMEFLSVVCGCETVTQEDGSSLEERFVATKKLFEYGFENFAYVQVVTTLEMAGSVPVALSAGRDTVVVHPAEDFYALLPDPYDKTAITTDFVLNGGATTLEAPLEAEQVVGTLSVYYNGSVLGTVDLSTTTAVARSTIAYTGKQTKSFLSRNWWVLLLALIAILLLALFLLKRAKKRRIRIRQTTRKRYPGQNRKEGSR